MVSRRASMDELPWVLTVLVDTMVLIAALWGELEVRLRLFRRLIAPVRLPARAGAGNERRKEVPHGKRGGTLAAPAVHPPERGPRAPRVAGRAARHVLDDGADQALRGQDLRDVHASPYRWLLPY